MELEMLTTWAGETGSPGFAWLGLAFGLGLVHAFDADHVAALSVFATGKRSSLGGLRAGLRWAIGHGVVLLVAGAFLFGVGRALPVELSILAERAVGCVMVVLGLYVFFDLVRRRAHLHFHAHEGLPAHAHWHTHERHTHDRHGHEAGSHAGDAEVALTSGAHGHASHAHEHGALMVGALHGLAGSAPILAILPAAARSPGLGLAYLLVFAIGVALAMAAVSGLLGHLAGRLSQTAQATGLAALRVLSALGSIALGGWLAWSS